MDKNKVERKAKKIEKIYQEYRDKIKGLEKEKDKVLEEFIHQLERTKLEEARNKLKSKLKQ